MIELAANRTGPLSLSRFQAQHSNASWDALHQQIKDDIHAALDQEQECLCVYCEATISRNTCHLEHLQPKGRHPQLTFQYSNLAQSCNAQNHCGHRKGGNEIPVLPGLNCNRLFSLSGIDGKIVAAATLTQQEKEDVDGTIKILNLNSPDLARQRQQFIQVLHSLVEQGENVTGFLSDQPFRHILKTIL